MLLAPNARQIYVGTGGTLVVKTPSGNLLTFLNVANGQTIAGWDIASIETGTTAAALVVGL